MIVPLEKPGTPEELVHFGVKGMQWGVRKAVDTAIGTKTAGRKPSSYKKPLTPEAVAARSAHRKSVAKKAAIGVGVAAVVVGTAYVAYKLHQSGHLPVNPLSNRHPADVKRLLDQNANVKLSGREWKRYNRMAAINRAQAARTETLRLQAIRNAARNAKS